jgi:uracil DNA glycosylase
MQNSQILICRLPRKELRTILFSSLFPVSERINAQARFTSWNYVEVVLFGTDPGYMNCKPIKSTDKGKKVKHLVYLTFGRVAIR